MEGAGLVEHCLARHAPGQGGDHDIARAHGGIGSGELLLRLNHQPAPALLVEVKGDVIGHDMAAADIDVKPGGDIGEHLGEVIILHVLGIGEKTAVSGHGALSRGFGGHCGIADGHQASAE